MEGAIQRRLPTLFLGGCLALLGWLLLQPYGWNATSFFHMDAILATGNPMPQGFVILDVPAYDGAQYYQITRNIPKIFDVTQWEELRTHVPTSYGYQRILLPTVAFLLSFGQTSLIPYAFLLINLLSLAGVFLLLGKAFPDRRWYAVALALCPAAMIGFHFNIAEPLTLFLLTAFLVRFVPTQRLGSIDVTLLCLLVLTREVNIFFAGLVGLWVLLHRQWRDVGLAFLPLLAFLGLHGWIYAAFGEVPFFMSTGKSTLPFQAVYELLTGGYGYDYKTLTSIPLFLFFVFPALAWTGRLLATGKDRSFLAVGSFLFLLLMCAMPDHIVGSITSIGRVITPVYPLLLFLAAKYDAPMARFLGIITLCIGLAAAFGLASVIHPFTPVP